MASNRFGLLALLAALLLFVGCGKERSCRVPIGDATCQIDPNSSYYSSLNNIGGYAYLVGGYQGILVIRTDFNSFVAYERTCPIDSAQLVMKEGYENIIECPKCKAFYFSTLDGMQSDGYCNLYEYGTYYDGQTLYISNY